VLPDHFRKARQAVSTIRSRRRVFTTLRATSRFFDAWSRYAASAGGPRIRYSRHNQSLGQLSLNELRGVRRDLDSQPAEHSTYDAETSSRGECTTVPGYACSRRRVPFAVVEEVVWFPYGNEGEFSL
jgi:hypothetical protein